MPDTNSIITDVINREGLATNDPIDKGGKTAYGISEASNPEAWKDGKVTEDEARAIYMKKYVEGPGFDKLPDPLKSQMVDFGVTSGPAVAVQKLQGILKVKQDGILGPGTFAASVDKDANTVNNQLVAERVKLIGRIVVKNPSQLKFLNGWLDRALQFLV